MLGYINQYYHCMLLFGCGSFLIGRNEDTISGSDDLSVTFDLVCSATTRPLLVLGCQPVLWRERGREGGREEEKRERENNFTIMLQVHISLD